MKHPVAVEDKQITEEKSSEFTLKIKLANSKSSDKADLNNATL